MIVTTRKAAFGIHLAMSLVILIILLMIIFFVWYPHELIYVGGIDGLKILVGIVLILGPLLTLIVFSPGKKGLKFDLLIIAIVQVSCLFYGTWIIYNQRPVIQVLLDDGVHLLSAADAKQYAVSFEKFPGKAPKNVLMNLPQDQSTWGTIKFTTEFADNKPFSLRSDLYLPMTGVSHQSYTNRLDTILKLTNTPKNLAATAECTWIPIISVHINGYACHSQKHGIERLSEKKIW